MRGDSQATRPGNSFRKGVVRSVRGSLGRFLAIMGIVALGCGFFAGLQMSGPDMRIAADRLYDGTALWDLRVISTLGLDEADIDRLEAIEGVSAVMPSVTTDAMARLGDEQIAVRISTLDVEAARASTREGLTDVISDDEGYLNRPMLVEGRWPEGPHECMMSADKLVGDFGVGDVVEVLSGGENLDDLLESRAFDVVGLVSSSNYPYTGSFGSTTLGSGMIGQYLYVTEAALAKDAPYTEAYLAVEGARELASEDERYEELVDATKTRLEGLADELARERQDDLKAKAQAELDEKWDEFQKERADAYRELEDARVELEDAQRQIADGQRQYEEGRQTYEDSRTAYEDGRRQLQEGEAAWAQGLDQLAQGLANAGIGGSTLEELRANVAATLDQARDGVAQLEDGISQADAGIAEGEAGLAQLAQGLDQVRALRSGLAQKREAMGLTDLEEALDAQLAVQEETLSLQRQTVEDQLAQARETRSALASQLAEVQGQAAQLEQALAGCDELLASREQLDASARQLSQGYDELVAGAAQLESSRQELDEALATYEDGLAQWQEGRAEADEKLGDAQRQLEEAQQKIDDLELPDLYVLDRGQNEGAATYHADSERIDSIADVFPFMFFLVAALVALTTMTRMVDDERQEIGTYKALGYGTARIASRYLAYAALAGTVGAVVGIGLLSQVLPFIIMSAYSIIYTFPALPLPLPIDLGIALAAGGLGVGVTLVATWFAVVSSLREAPATLMLPRAPASGKRILLERITPLWSRTSFSWKVTFRNLFRYKRRFFMTVVGISGCTALLLVGFGLHDSIWDIIDRQYGPIVHYDTTVGLEDNATSLDVDRVVSYLEGTGEVQDIVRVEQENMRAGGTDDASTSATGTTHVSVIIPRDVEQMPSALTFRERVSGSEVSFGANDVLVTEKLASLHGVEVGGTIVLYDQDDVGNAVGEGHPLKVTGVVENYVGNLVYVGRDAWRQVSERTLPFSTILCRTNEDAEVRNAVSAELHDMDDVSTVVYSDVTINMYRNMLSVVDMVVVVLIVSAGALAFIVLYNLTNINVGERVREIASLKVLGFMRGEVYAYIFREIAILAVIGDAVGMVLGTFLERFVVTTAEVDYVMFGRSIHPTSYVYSFALTLVFTAVVMLLMRRRLDRVDMVESLKSVD